MTTRTAPYGVHFVAPPGWDDVTYYRFRQFAEKRDFVIEEQEWDQSDPEGWLIKARGRLQQFGVSPIVSVPHPEFAVRGFYRLDHGSPTEPTLWLLTLSFDGQFRTLAVTSPTSEADVVALLRCTSGLSSVSYWVDSGT